MIRALLIAGFGLLLALQISLHAPLIEAGAPYESWDEIPTYNGSLVLAGPTADWIYRYGTLDTLLQLIGLDYFRTYDPLGAEYRHIAYSNNDPDSLNDEFYAFGRIRPDEFGYNYFRGVDDHRPITLSRWLHFGLFYALVALTGVLAIWLLGAEALWLVLPLLCLTVDSEVFLEAIQSLPNAINATLCFAVMASIGLAGLLRRGWLLYLAAALTAIALNFKIDAMPLGVVLGLALLLQDRQAGWRIVLRRCVIASIVFLAVLLLTDPVLVLDPTLIQKWLFPGINPPSSSLASRFGVNIRIFVVGLHDSLLPWGLHRLVPDLALPIAGLLAGAAILVLLRRQLALLRPAILPALAALLLWLPPLLLTQDYYPRYQMNGIASLYAALGIALIALWRAGNRTGRAVALVLGVLLLGQYGLNGRDGMALASQTKAGEMVMWGEGNQGWANTQSRNIVEERAIRAYLAGGYSGTILVDQHGYLDLRPLRLAGMNPVFVNMDTLDKMLPTLDPAAPHLLIYSPGSYVPDPAWWRPWMRSWVPETGRRYDAYQAALAGYPTLFDTGGPAQRLFWTGPVDGHDRMMLAAVPAAGS